MNTHFESLSSEGVTVRDTAPHSWASRTHMLSAFLAQGPPFRDHSSWNLTKKFSPLWLSTFSLPANPCPSSWPPGAIKGRKFFFFSFSQDPQPWDDSAHWPAHHLPVPFHGDNGTLASLGFSFSLPLACTITVSCAELFPCTTHMLKS